MGKIHWKPGTVLYPVPVVMVSCGDMAGQKDIVTVAWTGTDNTAPPMTYISLRPSRYSYDIIKKSGEFAINLVSKKLAFACDYCGVKSGREIDKFQKMHLTAVKGEKISAPIIYQSPVNIECRVKDILPLGTHDMFLAEVVHVSVTDTYLDERGKFHFDKTNPVCYAHGSYYTLSKALGGFGYSVKKKKKHKK